MTPPRPGIRRLAAVGLLVVLLLSVWNLVLQPVYRVTAEAVETLHDRRFELVRLEAVSRGGATLKPADLQAERNALHAELYLGSSDAEMEDRFVAAVNTLLQGAGARLQHLKAGAIVRSGPLQRLTADVQLACSEAQLGVLLTALHAHRPRMMVERAALVAAAGAPDPAAPPPELTVDLRLIGFGLQTPATQETP